MNDKDLKRKISKIIAGSIKSAIHDHPEYLSDDGKYIIRKSVGSLAKRAAGHVVRLMRMYKMLANGDCQTCGGTEGRHYGSCADINVLKPYTLMPTRTTDEDFEGMPPIKKLATVTGKTLPLKELEFVDWGAESEHRTEELIESTRDLREKAERNFADKLRDHFMGKTRC